MTIGIKWFILCAVLAAGEACAFALPYLSPAWPSAAALAILAALTAFGVSRRRWYLVSLFFAGMMLAWIAVSGRKETIVEHVELNRGRPVTAEFKIPESIRYYDLDDGSRKAVFAGEIRGVDVAANVYLERGEEVPKSGEIWRCTGWIGRESKGGIFGRRRFWVRGKGSGARFVADAGACGAMERAVASVRRDVSGRIGAGLAKKGEAEDLNRALLLGDRSVMDSRTRKVFADSGTAHLFAVSGLHVFVIAKFFSVILSFTGFPARFKAIPLIPLVWFYVLVVGAGPSSVRAGIMATFFFLAPLFWRKSDSLTAWALTFLSVHIAFPENLVNTGSQLSFVVMLGLVVWNRAACGLKGGFAKLFAPSFVAWVSGVPIVAATFAVITPGGLAANIIAVPAACCSVVLSASGVLASYVSDSLAGLFNAAAHMSTSILVGLARTAGAVGWSNFEVERWSFTECAAWYCAAAFGMWCFHAWRSRVAVRF